MTALRLTAIMKTDIGASTPRFRALAEADFAAFLAEHRAFMGRQVAAQGGSIGYSFVADAFLNFGALGVPLFSLLLGWGMVRFWRWADGRVGRLAVVATFVPHLLFSARAEIDVLPRPLVWYGFVPYALYLLIRRSIEERRPSSVAPRAA